MRCIARKLCITIFGHQPCRSMPHVRAKKPFNVREHMALPYWQSSAMLTQFVARCAWVSGLLLRYDYSRTHKLGTMIALNRCASSEYWERPRFSQPVTRFWSDSYDVYQAFGVFKLKASALLVKHSLFGLYPPAKAGDDPWGFHLQLYAHRSEQPPMTFRSPLEHYHGAPTTNGGWLSWGLVSQ